VSVFAVLQKDKLVEGKEFIGFRLYLTLTAVNGVAVTKRFTSNVADSTNSEKIDSLEELVDSKIFHVCNIRVLQNK
jgi:hypothetical protein